MLRIKLLKDWDEYKAGQVLDVSDAKATELIQDGIAQLYAEWEQQQKLQKEAEQAEDERIKRIVSETFQQLSASSRDSSDGSIEAKSVVVGEDRKTLDPKGGFSCFAEFGQAVYRACPEVRGNSGEIDPRLKTIMQIQDDDQGGYLVPQEFRATLLKRTYETGEILRRVQDIPMQSTSVIIPAISETSRAEGSRMGGIRVYRVAEGDQKTKSKPRFEQIELNLHTLVGYCQVSNQLLRHSAVSIEPILSQMFPEELRHVMEYEFIWGTGAGQPLGIMNAGCLVTVPARPGQAATTIIAENLIDMHARLWGPSRRNAVWMYNQDIEPQLHTMGISVGTGGVPVYLPMNSLAGRPYNTIYGLPAIPIEQAQTLGTSGDIMLCDWSQYLHGRESTGIRVDTSIHIRFDYNETAFRFELENDGQPWWRSDLTPEFGSNTVGPFVVLETRS